MSNIPIREAKKLATQYDWDQVIVIARKAGDQGCEHVITYGKGKAHCEASARVGMAVKHHLMKWPTSLFDSDVRVLGVGRDAENPRAVNIMLSADATDDDLRMIHEFLTPPTFSPQQVDEGADA